MKSPELRLRELGITLPVAPSPLGAYVPAVQSGSLLFLSGMIPMVDGKPLAVGRIGVELNLDQGKAAARAACLNALAVARRHLGSLERIRRVVRLSASMVAHEYFRDHPQIADGASLLLEELFGKEHASTRRALGIASLPLGVPVELELIFEIDVESSQ